MPDFEPAFLNRVWKFTGESNDYDAKTNVLNITVTKVLNLPKAMSDQDDEIVDQDAYVVLGKATKVYDASGKRIPREVAYDHLLDNAEHVKVSGKIMPPEKWQTDEDDMPVTTIRAKKVSIVD